MLFEPTDGAPVMNVGRVHQSDKNVNIREPRRHRSFFRVQKLANQFRGHWKRTGLMYQDWNPVLFLDSGHASPTFAVEAVRGG